MPNATRTSAVAPGAVAGEGAGRGGVTTELMGRCSAPAAVESSSDRGERPPRPAWESRPVSRTRWIGLLFAIGSACFVVGPFPGFVHLVGAVADAAVFFVGSLFFTSAAALQALGTPRSDRENWWAGVIQFGGTLFFNLSTGRALASAISHNQEDRLIWRPDLFGSICFLVASWLAWSPSAASGAVATARSRPSTSAARSSSASPPWRATSSPRPATSSTSPPPTSPPSSARCASSRAPSCSWRPHDASRRIARAARPALDRGARRGLDQDQLRPDLAQGAQEARRRLDEVEAHAAARLHRKPVRAAEQGQVQLQSRVEFLRQVPVAVDAPEQVRGVVVEAQGCRQ